MAKGSFSTKNLLLNAAVVLVGLALALLSSDRHAHWGPEGPVGGWLLLVPYLLMAAAVTAALIALGTFSWVPGGRLTCFAIWVGLLVAFAVSGYYSMSSSDTRYEQFAALSGWLLLAGCFVAVNAAPSIATRTAIVATLGLGGVAGWLQVAIWLSEYSAEKAQLAESRIAHEQEFKDSQEAEFRALGKEAPLWRYLGYMYISNLELRKECHEIIAGRADRDAQLVDRPWQRNPRERCDKIHRRVPSRARTSARSGLCPQVRSGSLADFGNRRWLRSNQRALYADIRDIIRAATRIQKGDGDLTAQMEAWRSYLKRFKNTAELVAEIDQTLPRPNAR